MIFAESPGYPPVIPDNPKQIFKEQQVDMFNK